MQGTIDFSFTPGKVLTMDKDVPNSKNITQADFIAPSIHLTQEEEKINTTPTPKVDYPQQDNRIGYLWYNKR
jgi:hypothetical protein